MVVTTDASKIGWGAHCSAQMAQGRWSATEASHSINWLELRAIFLALQAFRHLVARSHDLVLTDNISAKAHVNHQGGTRSRSLMLEAKRLCLWTEHHLISVKVEHILGDVNVQADWLSRQLIDHSEWRLQPLLFQTMVGQFGTPAVDLFASPQNAQLPRFFSHF